MDRLSAEKSQQGERESNPRSSSAMPPIISASCSLLIVLLILGVMNRKVSVQSWVQAHMKTH